MPLFDIVSESLRTAGPATINELAARTGLPLPSIRFHLYSNCERDDITATWIDAYSWAFAYRDNHIVRVFSLTGNGVL